MQRAVEESVERLLSSTSGEFERTVGRPLFKDITDGLLIEIQQVVIKAGDAALPKPLSQLAQKRLMLWVVLDSLRSPVVLSGADADRAGGRIWKQAQRVSAVISSTTAAFASQREAARAAVAAYSYSQAALVTELTAIDAGEKLRLDELRYEVYTGLHEVAAVVPDATPAPAPHVDTPKPSDTAIPAPTTSTGVRFPWLIPRTDFKETPPLPTDLIASLAPDGLQRLFSGYSASMAGHPPGDWWSTLPFLVNELTRELADAHADSAVRECGLRAQHGAQLEELAHKLAQLVELDHRDEAIRELTVKLVASEAKVEVLSEVLSRKNA